MQGGEVVHVARPPLFEPLMAGPRQQQHQQTGGFLPQANALPCGLVLARDLQHRIEAGEGGDDDDFFTYETESDTDSEPDEESANGGRPCTGTARYYGAVATGQFGVLLYELAGLAPHFPSAVTPGRVCVLAALLTLAYDNAVIALGRWLSSGSKDGGTRCLLALSHGRAVLRAGVLPLLLISSTEVGQQSGIGWLSASEGPQAVLDAPTGVAIVCGGMALWGLWLRVRWPRLEMAQSPHFGCDLSYANHVLEYHPRVSINMIGNLVD